MSKGGAGKVYFVLYLAVILELLIIIVERDEAEEHLIQKQKESMRIVESILSQLQTGAGTEGISTQSKDEITLQENADPTGPKIKQDRTYYIEVGVTDIFGADRVEHGTEGAEEKIRNLIKLANVKQLEYQVFYHPSEAPEGAPYFPPNDSIKGIELESEGQIIGSEADGNVWRLEMMRQLELDLDATTEWHNPVYKDYTKSIGSLQPYAPAEALAADSVYRYSADYTEKIAAKNGGKVKKRAFVVHFQAPQKPGWYKLRFASKTNRILGVGGDVTTDIPDDAKVNIGTVQLKVKDLRTVKKELERKLEGIGLPSADDLAKDVITAQQFDAQLEAVRNRVANGEIPAPNGVNLLSQIDLYRYISILLAPGKSDVFQQNRGSIEVDIRVIKPPVNIAEPYIELPPPVYYFDKLKPTFTFVSGPYMGNNSPEGRIVTPAGSIPLLIQPIEQTADAGSGGRGAKRIYRAVVQQTLAAGKYTIEVTQRNAGKSKTETSVLEVFPTALTEDNQKAIKSKMDYMYYGTKVFLDVEPSSLGKIPAGQFRTYASTNSDQQKPSVRGLSAEINTPAAANTASLRVTWVSPYTDEEVELFSLANRPIEQDPPYWDMSRISPKVTPVGTKKVKVEIRDITLFPATIDIGKESAPGDFQDIALQNIEVRVPGYELANTEIIEQGEGRYTALIELTGAPPRGESGISGSITGKVVAKVRNPINNKVSSEASETFDVSVDKEVGTDRNRGRGGRTAPPPRRR